MQKYSVNLQQKPLCNTFAAIYWNFTWEIHCFFHANLKSVFHFFSQQNPHVDVVQPYSTVNLAPRNSGTMFASDVISHYVGTDTLSGIINSAL